MSFGVWPSNDRRQWRHMEDPGGLYIGDVTRTMLSYMYTVSRMFNEKREKRHKQLYQRTG
jgi:hypothetical protein